MPLSKTSDQRNISTAGMLGRLGEKLRATRDAFAKGISGMMAHRHAVDDALIEELESLLLSTDVGIHATQEALTELKVRAKGGEISDADSLSSTLRGVLLDTITASQQPLVIPDSDKPFVILMIGVNGAGKTTTIGKLCHRLSAQGRKVMLAAGDTFRAAAVEQLQAWGKRLDVPVIAQRTGADSAAVIHDAMQAAQTKKMDVLLIDTAGRLQTQSGLMDELRKIKRVIQRFDATAPHEVLLVLDAGVGGNALSQLEKFHAAVGVTGLCMTKLDGTAKGGVLFALARKRICPIRFIGVGEGVDDLREFDANEFVSAILQAGPAVETEQ